MMDASHVPDRFDQLRTRKPLFWINDAQRLSTDDPLTDAVAAAEERMLAARELLCELFPQVRQSSNPLRSPLIPITKFPESIGWAPNAGRWLVKADHMLPVAGSIKARGGFHEVIVFAERLARENGILNADNSLISLAGRDARGLFSQYSIVTGSTGNLGLSIGLMSAVLGFKAVVHMSSDAKAWKKERLRSSGVQVIEHSGDYALAVESGRQLAEADPYAHFVDDERSMDLFAGYAAAAIELQSQLCDEGIVVDADHPLCVYIPCGVGGAPGGITYGLKRLFGPNAHCFFAEPVASPCMLVQLLSGDTVTSVYDVGLDNKTEADGLAVAQASMLVAPLMQSRLSGIYTVHDEQLYWLLAKASQTEGIDVEPSAAAAFAGPLALTTSEEGRSFLQGRSLADATHIVWTTGGSLVPEQERQNYLMKGPPRLMPWE
ncbi:MULTISPECIES: D-serine ammonia-lyase [unclassified Rhizobium]|uniref:D-serine ammonia-lyase n=1 Tax=unclassified Rhizobium TaxID=2613769 RepID=UPI00382037AE